MAYIKAKHKMSSADLKKKVREVLKEKCINIRFVKERVFQYGNAGLIELVIAGITKKLSEDKKELVHATEREVEKVFLKILEEQTGGDENG